MWIDLFVVSTLLTIGCIVFGRFEQPLPKMRRLGKLAITLVITGVISALIGHLALVFVAALLIISVVYHVQWCRQRGIDPVTGEPWQQYLVYLREKYGDAVREPR